MEPGTHDGAVAAGPSPSRSQTSQQPTESPQGARTAQTTRTSQTARTSQTSLRSHTSLSSETSPPPKPQYSIIVPTYNERENVAILVWMLHTYLTNVATFEVIFVDDASPDGTADVIRRLQAAYSAAAVRLVTRPGKLGLGSAYAAGLAASSAPFIILMDADLSHHPRHLPAFIAAQRAADADVVSGTRYHLGGGVAGWNLARKLTSRGANLLASFLLGASTSDLTGAFRLYRREALEALLTRTRSVGYAFQMEVIVRAQYDRLRIAEVPIVFVDRLYGESKLGVREYVQFVRGLLGLLLGL